MVRSYLCSSTSYIVDNPLLHEVNCKDGVYEYRGKQFSSLSRIAKEITGTHWSGPAFFGTKGRKA